MAGQMSLKVQMLYYKSLKLPSKEITISRKKKRDLNKGLFFCFWNFVYLTQYQIALII